MDNRNAIATFINAGIAFGRTPAACLALLTEKELNTVVRVFLTQAGTRYTVRMNMDVSCWARENNRIESIKTVRRITSCTVEEARNFVVGSDSLSVASVQKDELLRVFGNALAVTHLTV